MSVTWNKWSNAWFQWEELMLTRLGTVAFDFYKWDHVKLGECVKCMKRVSRKCIALFKWMDYKWCGYEGNIQILETLQGIFVGLESVYLDSNVVEVEPWNMAFRAATLSWPSLPWSLWVSHLFEFSLDVQQEAHWPQQFWDHSAVYIRLRPGFENNLWRFWSRNYFWKWGYVYISWKIKICVFLLSWTFLLLPFSLTS